MAIYGKDFYGRSKYGYGTPQTLPEGPLVAVPTGYDAVALRWRTPAGEWARTRLLRSRQGFARDEQDGTAVLDTDVHTAHFQDQGLAGGSWYYYTLFLQDLDGGWQRAAYASVLPVRDLKSSESMWERIPRYFRRDSVSGVTQGRTVVYDPLSDAAENTILRRFLGILGWGVDRLRNHQQTLLSANDPANVHFEGLQRLAEQFGTTLQPTATARLARSKVSHAANLARRRGTVDMLSELISLDTGWDVDVYVGHNQMLNADQAEFANPLFEEWHPGTKYFPGDRVEYQEAIFEAKAEAFGPSEAPPLTTENTWWLQIEDTDDTTLVDPDTNAVVTWKAYRENGTQEAPVVALGITSPVDDTYASNSLRVRNADSAAHTYDVWGAASSAGAGPLPDPEQVVRHGIPLPTPRTWSAEETYQQGDQVVYQGVLYYAQSANAGYAPATYPNVWVQSGVDERPLMGLSFYAHGPWAGTPGSGGVAVTPGLAFFDGQGQLLKIQDDEDGGPLFYDTFNNEPSVAFDQRTPDFRFAAETWRSDAGSWHVLPDLGNVAWSASSLGVTTVPTPVGIAKYQVAVTFVLDLPEGQTQALVVRYVDADNYMRVTRHGVDVRQAGVTTPVATFAETVADGSRVAMYVDETAGTWTVKVDGNQVASGTSLNTTTGATRHGMLLEVN